MLLHKVENYITSKYELRLNTISLSIEQRRKGIEEDWSDINDAELWRELNKEDIKVSIYNLQKLLRSEFIKDYYNPLQSYFLQLESNDYQTDSISQLSDIVILENDTSEGKENWKTHLEKWMISAIRTVFEPYTMNKYAIILVSQEEGTGKTFFCEFLCPKILRNYYTSNPIISHKKDRQLSLTTNFIINLDELSQFKVNTTRFKSWFSQPSINIRLPYDRKETTRARICSFVGSCSEDDFLRSKLDYSYWLYFKIKGTHRIEERTEKLLENAWGLAYKLYKKDPMAGELLKKDYLYR